MNSIKDYDFCGWVTKNDLECSDGRVIRKNAFAHQDGEKVPLAWNHSHNSPSDVLGYTILKNRDEGVYGYSFLNDTDRAKDAKILIEHGDIDSYSIFANHLKQVSNNVFHGDIKEVSLVFSGANPGAHIEDVSFAHSSDGDIPDEVIIYTGETSMKVNDRNLSHADTDDQVEEPTVQDVLNTLNEDQVAAVNFYINSLMADQIPEDDDEDDDEYIDDDGEEGAYNGYIDERMAMAHSDMNYFNEGDTTMGRTNIFDDATLQPRNYLTHSDFEAIKANAPKVGSFRQAYREYLEANDFIQHDDASAGISRATGTQEYGFNDPDMLFPDYKALDPTPEFIKRDDSWVAKFWGRVHRVPFARIKSLYADITEDAARAKGYIKGNYKKEEVFRTMKRVTDPTTVYKKQKLDKQDIDDITDFDVIAWIRSEMRVMLNEEIARAALIGDGRSAADEDKIDETKIRPVYLDHEFFVIRYEIQDGDPDTRAKNFIRGCVKARKQYKGSGNTTMFTTEDLLTDCLLLEDSIGHRLYKTESEVASATRVTEIATCELMEGLKNPNTNKECAAIILNPKDYDIGANKGGGIDMFDQFDIDYNQYKYLMETRCSGALKKYHSAIVIEFAASSNPSQA